MNEYLKTQFVPRSKHIPSRLQKPLRFDMYKKTGNVGLNVALRRFRVTIVVVGSNKWSECVFVALVIVHSTCMRRFILTFVAYMSLPYFSTLFHERHQYLATPPSKKVLLNVICLMEYITMCLDSTNTGTSDTTTFIVYICELYMWVHKSYARWDPIALTSLKHINYIKCLCLYRRAWRWPVYRLKHVAHRCKQ